MAAMMETESSDDEIIRKLAAGGSMDYSTWPLLLTTVVSRIEKIAHNDFPIPRIPQSITTAPPPPPPEPRFLAPLPPSSDAAEPPSTKEHEGAGAGSGSNNSSAVSSQETNKENAAPADDQPPAQPPPTSAPAPEVPAALELEPGTLPPQITAMLAEITGILSETFHTYPPHTIQRLAELVLEPRRHYKSLPSYLHAVDRVVHVTSGNNIYPLPPAIPDMSHMSINGVVDTQGQENGAGGGGDADPSLWASGSNDSSSNGVPIGSDEALGGALLTPIPWLARRAANGGDTGSESGESSTLGSEGGPSPLGGAAAATANAGQQRQANRQFDMQVRTESTETIDGPNGVGSIETVSVINGTLSAAQQQRVITQGELIRQEQRAGVVPVSQLTRGGPVVVTSPSTSDTSAVAAGDSEADTTMGEGTTGEGQGESEGPKDTSSDKADEEMADEEEGPHARGPDLIGAADMGPQTPSSSTFTISGGGNPEVRGIDVEAAVGRKHEAQIPTAEGEAAVQSESSDSSVVLTPASTEPEMAAEQQMEVAQAEGESGSKDESNDDASGEKAAEKKGEEREEEVTSKEAQTSEGMDTEPSSATMTASPSPALGKREAEDDISETESMSSKRLKGSPERDNGAGVEDASRPSAAEAENDAEADASDAALADDSAAPEAQPASESKEEEGEPKKDNEGDIVLSDQSAKANNDDASIAEPAPAPPADETGIGDEKEEDAEKSGAKAAETTG